MYLQRLAGPGMPRTLAARSPPSVHIPCVRELGSAKANDCRSPHLRWHRSKVNRRAGTQYATVRKGKAIASSPSVTGRAPFGGIEHRDAARAVSDVRSGGHGGEVPYLMQRDKLAGGVLGLVLGLC